MSDSLEQIVRRLLADTAASCPPFAPELILSATIVLILLARMIAPRIDSLWIALAGAAAAAACSWPDLVAATPAGADVAIRPRAFTEMLAYDGFALFARAAILLSLALLILFTRLSGVPDRDAGTDVYTLLLGATIGMCLMVSADHWLMVFLGVEMASVPSYALAGLAKGRRNASEAAIKYAVYGAGAAGVMLYGASLLTGLLDCAHLPTMASRLARLLSSGEATAGVMTTLTLAALFVMAGLAFKLAAVPFHFWCPDVFEGATAEVNAFLSVASKTAALGLLVRVAMAVSYPPAEDPAAPRLWGAAPGIAPAAWRADAESAPPVQGANDASAAAVEPADAASQAARPATDEIRALAPVREFLGKLLALIASVTCTFGNLAAYGQTDIKRLLAYSTIAQAGYMIMPVAAALLLVDQDPAAAESAIAALAFYLAVYLFMKLGSFAVVALVRNSEGSERIADFAGLVHRAPVTAISFVILLLSLIGLPPLGGFFAKFFVFAALYDAGLIGVLVVAGLNTAVSLIYYMRVVKVMTFDHPASDRLLAGISAWQAGFVVAMTAPVVWWGIASSSLQGLVQAATRHLY